MKDFTKWWISGVASVISFIANLAAATSWIEEILMKRGVDLEKAEYVNDFFLGITPILFTITLIAFIFYSAVNLCSKELSKSGTHGIPCTLHQYRHFRRKNKTEGLLNAIHRDLYHCTHSIKKNIKRMRAQNPACIQSIKDVPEMKRLLQSFQTTLYYQFNIDASISIYRARETEDKQKVLIRDMFVKNNDEKQMSNGRRQDNIYLIAKEPEESMKDLTAKAEKYRDKNGRGAYHKNSAFDFILSNPHNSWLSNDLTVDVAKREFFTSSYNYSDFYKSLAAFVILPPECNDNRDDLIKGILTFDTIKTGMFLEKECVAIMGLMAHLVNEIYDSLN